MPDCHVTQGRGDCEIGSRHAVVFNSVAVSVVAIASSVVELFLSAYVARQVGTGAMGAFYLIAAIVSYLALCCNPGLTLIAQRQAAKRPAVNGGLVRLITSLQLAAGLVAYFVLALCAYAFAPTRDYLLLALIAGHVLVLTPFNLLWILHARQKMVLASIATLFVDLLKIPLVLLVMGEGADVILYALTFVPVLVAKMACFWVLARRARIPTPSLRLRISGWRPFLTASLPAGVSLGAVLIYYNADTPILGLFRSSSEVGLYGSAYSLMLLLAAPSFAINRAYFPELSRSYAKSKSQGTIVSARFSSVLAWLGVPLGVIGALCGDRLFVAVYGPGFTGGAPYFQLLCINLALIHIAMGLGSPLVAWGYQATHMKITMSSAVLNLMLNFLCIPPWGAMGAAAATIASEGFVIAALLFVRIRKGIGHFPLLRVFGPPIAASAILAVAILCAV